MYISCLTLTPNASRASREVDFLRYSMIASSSRSPPSIILGYTLIIEEL